MLNRRGIVWVIVCFLLLAAVWGASSLNKKQMMQQIRKQALIDWERAESTENSAADFHGWKMAALSWEKAAHSSNDGADVSVASKRFWDAITFAKQCWRMTGEFASTQEEREEVEGKLKKLATISLSDRGE